MNFNKMTDYEIATSPEIRKGIDKILNKHHRRYTFDSPIYSNGINMVINQYQNGFIDYNTAKTMINEYERQNQLDYINLLTNGPSGWENSSNISKAVDLLNYNRMNSNYENGVYRDKGLNDISSNININNNIGNESRRDVSVLDITSYLNWLKEEVK